eukprot:evm.model.NODE_526_length_7345_cov_21.990469.3
MSAAEAEAHKATGNKALQAKEFDEAISAYTKAIEVSASLPVSGEGAAPRHVYFSNRSAAYLSKNDAVAALEDAEQCIQANPTWAKGFSRKGAALHAMKKYDDAQAAYEAGLQVAPEDAGLAAALDDVKKAKQGSSQPRANPLASIFAPENVARLSTHPVFCKYMMDEEFKAKMHLLQTDPSAINTILQDKRVMEVFGFLTGIDMRAGGMEGEEEESSAYGNSSSSSSSSSDNKKQETPAPAPEPADEELTEAERELRKRKREALEAKERGNKHYVKKEFSEALAAYEEAIEKDPSNMAFLTNKAAVFFEQGEYAQAVSQCEEAIQGLQKTMMKIRESSSEEADMERAAHGMADPEIQAILSDPVIQQVLRDVQENPREGQKAMSDPGVAAKIEKLINAGVLRTR